MWVIGLTDNLYCLDIGYKNPNTFGFWSKKTRIILANTSFRTRKYKHGNTSLMYHGANSWLKYPSYFSFWLGQKDFWLVHDMQACAKGWGGGHVPPRFLDFGTRLDMFRSKEGQSRKKKVYKKEFSVINYFKRRPIFKKI